jgi:hypothetical protein
MTNPAEQAAPQPETELDVPSGDDEFAVTLPTSDGDAVRHVVVLRGDQIAFTTAYDSFVSEAAEASAPLFAPAHERDLVVVRDVLDGLGGATVERIDDGPA